MNYKNPNHPKKGSTIKVEPITELTDIKLIKKLLKDKPRDHHCLFTMGINTKPPCQRPALLGRKDCQSGTLLPWTNYVIFQQSD